MGKIKSKLFEICFFVGFSIVVLLLLSGIIFLKDNNLEIISLSLGILGIIILVIQIICGIIIMNQSLSEKSDKQNELFLMYMSEIEKDPNKFMNKLKFMINFMNIYIVVLVISILLSFVGVIMIGVVTQHSPSFLGLIYVALTYILYYIFKSIYIEKINIEEHEITSENYPKLFEVINRAMEKFKDCKIDKIYIVPTNNCGVATISYGFGFKSSTVLTIGINYLYILNEKELEAVLLHELAHIYNNDTVILTKAQNNLCRFEKIYIAQKRASLIERFALIEYIKHSYIKLNLALDSIRRFNENEADRVAVKYIDKNIFISALVKTQVLDHFINRDIKLLEQDLNKNNRPPKNLYSITLEFFNKRLQTEKKWWIDHVYKRISSLYEDHPSLSERMKQLDVNRNDLHIEFQNENSFKNEADALIRIFNKQFYDEYKDSWDEFRSDYLENCKVIKDYENNKENIEYCDYLIALEGLNRVDEAFNGYCDLIFKNPDDSFSLFRKGCILLEKYDNSGIDYIKKSMELDFDIIPYGSAILEEYFHENGMLNEKEENKEWFDNIDKKFNDRMEEEANIRIDDEFSASELDEETIKKIVEILSKDKKVRKVYLFMKKLKNSDEKILNIGISYKGEEMIDTEELTEFLSKNKIEVYLHDFNYLIKFMNKLDTIENTKIFDSKMVNKK